MKDINKSKCKVCQQNIPPNAHFCPYCGENREPPRPNSKRDSLIDKIVIGFVILCVIGAIGIFAISLYLRPSVADMYLSGNSSSNYSSKECRFAENDDYIVFSDFEDNRISVYDKTTSESSSLDLFGTNLSIYKDTLYFIAEKYATIGSYNLKSGEYKETSVENYFTDCKVVSLDKLFVTEFGFTVACSVADSSGKVLSAFVQRDWADIVRIDATFYTSHLVLIASQVLAYADNSAENPTVYFIDLDTYSIDYLKLRPEIEYLYYGNDNNLYISMKDAWIIVAGPEGDGHSLFLNDNINGSLYVYKNYLFYPSEKGLVRYNTKTEDSSLFIENFLPRDIYFSSEGCMILSGTDTATNKTVFAYSSVKENTLQNLPIG